MKELQQIWIDNGFPSGERLWTILKKQGLAENYIKSRVVAYIADQKTNQLHRRPVKAKHSYITTTNPGVMYCIDLLDMTAYARENGGIKWLLLCIDIFSRVAVIAAAKNKTAPVICEALKDAFDQMGEYPKVVLSDQGSEFKGATAKFLADHGIIHRTAEVGDHRRLGIVDRFSGIVKGWIARYQTHHQSSAYLSALPGLIEKYNAAPHSSLGGMAPNEAWEFPSEARSYHYNRITKGLAKQGKRKSLKVGDWVRVLKLRGVFDKGYHVKYSLTPHKIVEVKGLNYILDNGRFYRASRLMKIGQPEEEAATPTRDVAKEARRERKVELDLQQQGVDPVVNPPLRRSARERRPQNLVVDDQGNRVIFSKHK